MSDPTSALSGATASGFVKVVEAGLVGMVTIRGDLSDAAFGKAVKQETGVDMPAQGERQAVGDNALLWMSPDELLLICPHEAADPMVGKLTAALGEQHHLAVNVSDARAVFRLSGEGGLIRDALAKLTPADLRTAACPVGRVRRTRLAQVPAAIWFDAENEAQVVCFRSVAEYVFGLLENATKSGSEVGYYA